jgi:hypothetical protein
MLGSSPDDSSLGTNAAEIKVEVELESELGNHRVFWPSFRDINKHIKLRVDTAQPLYSGTTGKVYDVALTTRNNTKCVVKIILFCTDSFRCPSTCAGINYKEFKAEITYAKLASSAGIGPLIHRTFVVYHQDNVTPNWGAIQMDQYDLTLDCFIRGHKNDFGWVDRVTDCIHVMATHGILLLDMKSTNIVVRWDGSDARLIDYNSSYCVPGLITPQHTSNDERVVIIAIEIVMCMLLYSFIRDWVKVDAWPLLSHIKTRCDANSSPWHRAYDVLMVQERDANAILGAYQDTDDRSLPTTPWSFLMAMHTQIYKRTIVFESRPLRNKRYKTHVYRRDDDIYNTCQM